MFAPGGLSSLLLMNLRVMVPRSGGCATRTSD
jgi:hypothetical protein